MITHLTTITKMYDTIQARLENNAPFTTPRTAFDGYERLMLVNNEINIGLDYIAANSALFLMANSRTHSLASLHVATRRGRSDYESRLTPERYGNWCSQAFDLTDADARLLAAYLTCRASHGALNGRLERALDLASSGHVKPNVNGDWLVASQSSDGSYNVHNTADGWYCGCQDSQHGGPDLGHGYRACKHICAVWLTIKAKKAEPKQYRNGSEQARCATCGQPWRRCGCSSSPATASVAGQRKAARASLNLPKNQPKHRPAYQFTGHRYGQ